MSVKMTADAQRILIDCADALAKAGHGEKQPIKEQACQRLGCSMAALHRQLNALRATPARKRRTDAGQLALTEGEASELSAILMAGLRRNGKQMMSLKMALKTARDNGRIRAERIDPVSGEVVELSETAVARALRHYGCHPEQLLRPAPHISMQSLHPNHVWQVDASVCVLFYLRAQKGQGLGVMEHDQFYKNKPENFVKIESDRVVRYVLTDHYSGTIYVQYFMGSESGLTLAEFLIAAMHPRDTSKDPFHGRPVYLMMDPGSANIGRIATSLCRALDISVLVNKAGQPRAKGSVENAQNIVECGYESTLRFQPVGNLEELNRRAHIWMRWFNGTSKHSRHGHTRYALWQTIRANQLITLPGADICREYIMTGEVERKVTIALTISHKGVEYDVSTVPNIMVGEKIKVCVNPYRHPALNVIDTDSDGNQIYHLIEPIQKNAAGFREDAAVIGQEYKSHSHTVQDHARADAEERLGLVDKKANAAAFNGEIDPHINLEAETAAHFMPRRGESLVMPELPHLSREEKTLTITAAAMSLVKRGVEITPMRRSQLESWYPNGVPESEMDLLQERISKVANLRAVG